MAGYMDELTKEQLKHMNGAIDTFLGSYKASRNDHPDRQKTVLFFPGGMGSELSQANNAFGSGGNYTPYNQFWYDWFQIQIQDHALWLQMRREADGVDYDSGKKFILASGEFNNCLYAPYDGFVDWCGQNQLDLLVCGWDNRRNPDWLVSFFMNHLPDYVRQRAAAPPHNINTDPMADVYLVGHSEGGNLIKWMLNDHTSPFCRTVRLAVTVATPFYGNTSQSHRMFEGEPLVGGDYKRAQLATAIATMPGGYVLFFLDEQTYIARRALLEADVYPLVGYPSVDQDDGSNVDPYVYVRGGNRYCEFGWDLKPYIDEGLRQYKLTAKDLDASVKGQFHNIRGVQTEGGADRFGTPGSLTWRGIDGTFNRNDDPSPIVDGAGVPGDGVVPAWSARLLPAQEGHVHTVWGEAPGFEHMTLMESDGVLAKLWELLQTGQPRRESQLIMARRQIEPAPVIELKKTMQKIRDVAERAKADKKDVAAEVHAYVQSIKPVTRMALIKGWYIERAKGPRAEAQNPDPPKKAAPPAEKMTPPKKTAPTKGRADPKKPSDPKGRNSRRQ